MSLFKNSFGRPGRPWTNRSICLVVIVISISQLLVFRYFYPFPEFTSDSYSYLYEASNQPSLCILPIGYSMVLAALHRLSGSDTTVVVFQYILLISTFLFFYLIVNRFYALGSFFRKILFVFFFINPLFLYLSNSISAEPVFLSLSVLWFAHILWSINRPSKKQFLIHSIILTSCLLFSHHAWYYGLISSFVFYRVLQGGLKGVLAGIVPILTIVLYFGSYFPVSFGWDLAANSLAVRRHIIIDKPGDVPGDIRSLDSTIGRFLKHTEGDWFDAYLVKHADFFVDDSRSPLNAYAKRHFALTDANSSPLEWRRASMLFRSYGIWLIVHYPLVFVKYFVFPEIGRYLVPSLGSLSMYNQGKKTMPLIGQEWFEYETPFVTSISTSVQGDILFPVPFCFLMLQVLYVGICCWWYLKKTGVYSDPSTKTLFLISQLLFVFHFLDSIFSGKIQLKDQVFPAVLFIVIDLLFMEYLDSSYYLAMRGPECKVTSAILIKR